MITDVRGCPADGNLRFPDSPDKCRHTEKHERPETWVTLCTGHMGNTSRMRSHAGGVDALEGVFSDGRAHALRRPVARGRADERDLPRVRHLSQDRLQDP